MLCYYIFTHKSFKTSLSVAAVVYLGIVVVVVVADTVIVVVDDVIDAASAVDVVVEQRLLVCCRLSICLLMLRKGVRCRPKNVVFLHL